MNETSRPPSLYRLRDDLEMIGEDEKVPVRARGVAREAATILERLEHYEMAIPLNFYPLDMHPEPNEMILLIIRAPGVDETTLKPPSYVLGYHDGETWRGYDGRSFTDMEMRCWAIMPDYQEVTRSVLYDATDDDLAFDRETRRAFLSRWYKPQPFPKYRE